MVGTGSHRHYTEDHSRDQRQEIQMSRFAVVHEDPSYDEPEDIMEWLNGQIDEVTVVKKPQEEFGPFETINS